jgi:hypothetical protein
MKGKVNYFRTGEIEGEKPFRCYVCNKYLFVHVEGEYVVKLVCPRCKTKIVLECRNPLPNSLVVKHGELVNL